MIAFGYVLLLIGYGLILVNAPGLPTAGVLAVAAWAGWRACAQDEEEQR